MNRSAAFLALGIATMIFGAVLACLSLLKKDSTPPTTDPVTEVSRLEKRILSLEERLKAQTAKGETARIVPAVHSEGSDSSPSEEGLEGPAEEEGEGPDSSTDNLLGRLDDFERRLQSLEQDPVQRGYNFLESQNPELRRQGILALERIAQHDPQAREAIRQMLLDPDARVRHMTLDTLADIGDKEAVPGILSLLSDSEANVRQEAINTLTRLGSGESSLAIAQLLSDQNAEVRAQAADSMGKLKAKDSADFLLAALKDGNDNVRGQAISSLGEVGAKEAIPFLRDLYAKEPGNQRMRLVRALQQLGDTQPYKTEISRLSQAALSGDDSNARRDAIRTLSYFAREESKAIFEQALQDSDGRVRYEAQRALRGREEWRGRGRGR